MKYLRTFYFISNVGFLLVGLLFGLRMIAAIMAATGPVLDAVIGWMADHALVGGLTLAIGFLVFWFGEECERQIRKERNGKC